MKKITIAIFVVFVLAFTAANLFAEETKPEEAKVTGSVSTGVFNRYIFRGYELSSGSAVIQPAVTVSYKGFSIGFWSNIDTNENPTQSFVPDRPDRKSFNETDITLSYSYSFGKLGLTGGYIYYGTKYANETEELFLSASYDVITKPTLTVNRDIGSYPGTYFNLSLSHSIPVYKEITLDLGASAGYFAGDDDFFRTADPASGTLGKKYSAFHDGMVKTGLTIPITKAFSIQPVAQYWFPLSSDAKKHNFNPNGHLDDTFVTGLNAVFTF